MHVIMQTEQNVPIFKPKYIIKKFVSTLITSRGVHSGHLCDRMEVSVMNSHGNAIFWGILSIFCFPLID